MLALANEKGEALALTPGTSSCYYILMLALANEKGEALALTPGTSSCYFFWAFKKFYGAMIGSVVEPNC